MGSPCLVVVALGQASRGRVVSLRGAGEEVAGGESKDAGHGGEQGAVAVDADQTGTEGDGDGDGLGVVMRVSMAE
jgi:hypothetical protein